MAIAICLSMVATPNLSFIDTSLTVHAAEIDRIKTEVYYAKGNRITDTHQNFAYKGQDIPVRIVKIESYTEDSELVGTCATITKTKKGQIKAGNLNAVKLFANSGVKWVANSNPVSGTVKTFYDLTKGIVKGYSKNTVVKDAKESSFVAHNKKKIFIYMYFNRQWHKAYEADILYGDISTTCSFYDKASHSQVTKDTHTKFSKGSLDFDLEECYFNAKKGGYEANCFDSYTLCSLDGEKVKTVKILTGGSTYLGMKPFPNGTVEYY